MDAGVSAALIGAGASIATNTANQLQTAAKNKRQYRNWLKQQEKLNQYQIAAEKRQFDYNQQIRDDIFAQNLAQWNRENAYNSPSAQMSRFSAAGLNANLVYGQSNLAASSPEMVSGSGVGSGSPSVGSGIETSMTPFDFSSGVEQMISAKLAEAQINKLNAETVGILSDNDWKDSTLQTRIEQVSADLLNTVEDTKLKDSQGNLASSQSANVQLDTEIKTELKQNTLDQAAEDLENKKTSNLNLHKTTEILEQQIKGLDLDNKIKKHIERIQKYESDIKKIDAANWSELTELKKRKENANISYLNQETAYLGKKIGSYDQELQAKLALSAATTLMYNQHTKLFKSQTTAQDLQNTINDILLNPTSDTDNMQYFSALILKMMSDVNVNNLINIIDKHLSGDIDVKKVVPQNSDTEKKEVPQNNTKIPDGMQKTYDNLPPDRQKRFDVWMDEHPDASEKQISDALIYLLHSN